MKDPDYLAVHDYGGVIRKVVPPNIPELIDRVYMLTGCKPHTVAFHPAMCDVVFRALKGELMNGFACAGSPGSGKWMVHGAKVVPNDAVPLEAVSVLVKGNVGAVVFSLWDGRQFEPVLRDKAR